MKNVSSSWSSALFSGLEQGCIQGFDFLSHVSISALDHTHEVLDHTEKFARRLAGVKENLDKYTEEQRLVLKQQLMAACRDSVELGTEAIHSVAKLLHLVLEETQELQRNSDEVWKEFKTDLEIPNPFRTKPSTVAKQPTIIPISIQDN